MKSKIDDNPTHQQEPTLKRKPQNHTTTMNLPFHSIQFKSNKIHRIPVVQSRNNNMHSSLNMVSTTKQQPGRRKSNTCATKNHVTLIVVVANSKFRFMSETSSPAISPDRLVEDARAMELNLTTFVACWLETYGIHYFNDMFLYSVDSRLHQNQELVGKKNKQPTNICTYGNSYQIVLLDVLPSC